MKRQEKVKEREGRNSGALNRKKIKYNNNTMKSLILAQDER